MVIWAMAGVAASNAAAAIAYPIRIATLPFWLLNPERASIHRVLVNVPDGCVVGIWRESGLAASCPCYATRQEEDIHAKCKGRGVAPDRRTNDDRDGGCRTAGSRRCVGARGCRRAVY